MRQARRPRPTLAIVEPSRRNGSAKPQQVAGIAPVLARVVAWRPSDGFVVVLADEPDGPPRVARSTVRVTDTEARVAAACGQEVLVAFARNAPDVPIVVGLLQPPGGGEAAKAADVILDGERVVLRGRSEVELRCGKGSVILKADGLVVVKGANVETRALGVNRIRGGSVKIN